MKKFLAIVGIVVMTAVAQAALINPSFELGNYDGWDRYDRWGTSPAWPDGLGLLGGFPKVTAPSVSVVQSYGALTPFSVTSGGRYGGHDSGGDYFVQIQSGDITRHQGIVNSDVLTVGGNGSVYGWFTKDGSVILTVDIVNADTGISAGTKVFSGSDLVWQEWSFTGLASGSYYLVVDVTGGTGKAFFDMSAVPEAKGWMMGGALVGIFGLATFLRRRQAKATA